MSKYPKREVEVVERWRCSRGHRHSTLSLAKACEARVKRKAVQRAALDKKEARRLRRHKDAYDLRASGKTWKDIGRIVGRLDDPTKPVAFASAVTLAYRWDRRLIRLGLPSINLRGHVNRRAGVKPSGQDDSDRDFATVAPDA